MDIQRILILLGLAVTAYLLILAWNEDYGVNSRNLPVETVESTIQEATVDVVPETTTVAESDVVPQLAEENHPTARPEVVRRRLVTVVTDVLDLQIDLNGGDIVRVALPKYPATLETPEIPFLLVDPRNSYVAQSGLIGRDGTDRTGSRPVFTVDVDRYEMNAAEELKVTLRYQQESGAEILKHFLFKRGSYLVQLEYEIAAAEDQEWRGALFTQIKRDGQMPFSFSESMMGMRPYVGGATRSGDELYRKLEFDDLEDESYKLTREDGYIALVEHYFVTAWVPADGEVNNYQARKLKGQDLYLFGFTTPAISVPAAGRSTLGAQYYVGPKDQYVMREIAEGLELTVDYGFLWWLAQPLFYLLTVLHSVVGNWGVAIILLTVIVKALLFPLSAASFKSMAKMRKLQPEMARLKERYGEDRQKFSQATMDLYKKEGANPLGGCFPILLQMPVFLALYWTLMESVELRQAPFMLWIYDLSTMDPYFVLPILMGISMFLTQMLQPEPPDPVQAKVFKFMPIMFTFFFLWFPSGLVLYWLVNNILSIMQQWHVTRQIEKAG
ncbi:MAG: membrane protein insertase YidC [Gammaproteobacteria bacterium]|jgi:YidC/Oxa1 family membrane protein insertase|nr:membrane protein insertase YidC [Gammaproteobacteria bacterium]